MRLTLAPEVPVAGVVRDQSGRGVPGVRVITANMTRATAEADIFFRRPGDLNLTLSEAAPGAMTDAEGRFTLHHLPPAVASNPSSLAQRNLERAWRLGLPSGQNVARAMHLQPLADKDIIIGKGTDDPDPDAKSIVEVSKVFANNCALWTYILAEAMHFSELVKIPVVEDVQITTPRLGPVGGRIVAEVFLGLMFGDAHSLLSLDPHWHPEQGEDFALKDFVKYALGQ